MEKKQSPNSVQQISESAYTSALLQYIYINYLPSSCQMQQWTWDTDHWNMSSNLRSQHL